MTQQLVSPIPVAVYVPNKQNSAFRFRQFLPKVPCVVRISPFEEITYRAVIEVYDGFSPLKISVQIQTNQQDQESVIGEWHDIDLPYRGPHADRRLSIYGQSCIILGVKTFDFNYRAKYEGDDEWTLPPKQPLIRGHSQTSASQMDFIAPFLRSQPDFTQIVGPLYIGNELAANAANRLGFTHLLCLAEELKNPTFYDEANPARPRKSRNITIDAKVAQREQQDRQDAEEKRSSVIKKESRPEEYDAAATNPPTDEARDRAQSVSTANRKSVVLDAAKKCQVVDDGDVHPWDEKSAHWSNIIFHKIPMRFAIEKPVDANQLVEAVDWVRKYWREDAKMLVYCKFGFMRAGCVAVAFVMAQNPTMPLAEAYQLVYCRRPVYLSHMFGQIAYQLYPR